MTYKSYLGKLITLSGKKQEYYGTTWQMSIKEERGK